MKIYVVKKSDTLPEIAQQQRVSLASLIAENALSCQRLSPGQCLIIPDDSSKSRGSMELCAFYSQNPGQDCLSYSLPGYTYTAPWAHSLSQTGQLLPPAAYLHGDTSRQWGCAPLLCLANLNPGGGFSPSLAHRLFTEPDVKACLFSELMQKLEAGQFYGLHLSFNYLFPFDMDNYSAFSHELAEILHHAGFFLSVEIAPKDSPALSAAQDYSALAQAADRLSLMFCRWAHPFSPPQAMAATQTLRSALDEAVSVIAPQKLWLGLSGNGYDWPLPWRQGNRARPISNHRAVELAAAVGAEIKRDKSSNSPYFLYRDAEQKRRAVFYEDLISLKDKLSLMAEFGLCGISLYGAEYISPPVLSLFSYSYSTEKLL